MMYTLGLNLGWVEEATRRSTLLDAYKSWQLSTTRRQEDGRFNVVFMLEDLLPMAVRRIVTDIINDI